MLLQLLTLLASHEIIIIYHINRAYTWKPELMRIICLENRIPGTGYVLLIDISLKATMEKNDSTQSTPTMTATE